MIRKHKRFNKPKDKFDLGRIKKEEAIVKKYGLKNKREIWKVKAKLDKIRNQAKKLIEADEEQQATFIKKLQNLGFDVANPVEVLALTEEDILKRRLQTIVFKKGIATTPKGARQVIVHKNILVDGKVINVPSYEVGIDEEKKISAVIKKRPLKKTMERSGKKVAQLGEVEDNIETKPKGEVNNG